MDQIKQNLFWIILGVVVLAAVGIWFSYLPDVDKSREDFKSAAKKIKEYADKSNKTGSSIKSPAHVKAAEAYGKDVEAQKTALMKKWETQKIDVKFADVPGADKPTIEFDNYIGKLRDTMAEKMTAAGVKVPETWPALTFAGTGTDDKSQEINRHRVYRLRYMAVLEEVVDALCSKTGSIKLAEFQTDPAVDEPTKSEPVGPIALLKFSFHTPEDTAKIDQQYYDKAMVQIAQRKQLAGASLESRFKGPEAPLDTLSVDVEFLSHLSAVPGVMRKMESSSRYFGILTKGDFERAAPLFPPTKEVKDPKDPLFNAKPIPMLNTHYAEGPVRVLVTMSILEFNKKKAEAFDKAVVAAPAPAPTKK